MGLSFTLCQSAGTEPGGKPLRWQNGHGDRSGAVGVVTSPGPSPRTGGAGRLAALSIFRTQPGGKGGGGPFGLDRPPPPWLVARPYPHSLQCPKSGIARLSASRTVLALPTPRTHPPVTSKTC